MINKTYKKHSKSARLKQHLLLATLTLSCGFLTACSTNENLLNASEQSIVKQTFPSSTQVLADMEHVANWQLPRVESLQYIQFKRGESLAHKRWVQGVFYTGLTRIAERSLNPTYSQWIGYKSKEWDWALGPITYFGDDQLIADTYIWYYLNHDQNPDYLAATIKAFDDVIETNSTVDLAFTPEVDENSLHLCQQRWCWADAIFMAPPSWFALSKATGDPKYAAYAHKEIQATINYLFDEEYNLLYRDSRFKEMKGDFGEQLFWARGTGWVFAGLARAMDYIDKDDPQREFYETLFVKMAKKLKTLQKKDGSWAMSLLAQEKSPLPETSGTGFFTYGLAWGINNGLLSEEEFGETTAKGWALLNSAVHPDGKLGWVQAIGAAPGQVSYDDSQLYGVGGYLLAGAEIYDMMKAKEKAQGLIEPLATPIMAFARYVPERRDDFAWENDKVAFRVYGPAAPEKGHSSGVDAWLKKVDYSIIDKWYAGHSNGTSSYHEDTGEGYDPYHTGISRGVGGSAVWVNGKAYAAHNWETYKVHINSGKVTSFTLTYSWDTPLGKVNEDKTITLALGEHLYHVDSNFTLNGKPAKNLPIAIGIATHDEKATVYQNKVTGRISAWETFDGQGLGTAAIMDASRVKDIKHIPSKVKDESHIWMFTSTDEQGQLSFKSGFGWQAAGVFDQAEKWNSFADNVAKKAQW